MGTNGDGSCCSTVLGRVSPFVAEVTAIASVLRMLRVARVSIPLTVLSDSEKALGVVLGDDRALSELPLVPLARSEARHHRQRAGIEEHASNGGCGSARGGWPQAIDGSRAGSGAHLLRTAGSSRGRVMFRRLGRQDPLAPTKTGQSLARKIQRNT